MMGEMAGHPIFAALYDRMLASAERAGLAERRAAVVSTLVLCSVADPDRAASEIARVLSPAIAGTAKRPTG
jgi:hypothetical protein